MSPFLYDKKDITKCQGLKLKIMCLVKKEALLPFFVLLKLWFFGFSIPKAMTLPITSGGRLVKH